MYGIQAAMGYILHAVFVTGTDHTELKEFHQELVTASHSNESTTYSNTDTTMLLVDTLQGYGVDGERIELISQVMFWLFDSHTVGEAEKFHEAYQFILGIHSR